MNRLDWLKAIRRGLSANAVIAIGAFTTYLFSDGVVSAAAIAVLLLDAMSAAVFLLSSYLGKTAAEMALVMTVLSVIVLSTAGAYLVSYLFSNLPESVPSAVETEAGPPAYFEESESPIDTMNGNQSPSPDDLPLVIAEKDEEDGSQDESEPSSAETEAEDSVPAPEEIIIGQEPIIEEPAAEETDAESVAEAVIDEPVYAEESSAPVVAEEPAEEAPVSTAAEAVIEEEPEEVIAESVTAEEPVEETSEPVVTEEPVEEAQEITAAEEAIEEDDETTTAVESSEFAADDFFAGLSEDEAAFWADFYIAGEDELALEDGIYYMDLYINETAVGSITVEMRFGEPYLSASELKSYMGGTITDEAYDRIFGYSANYISLSELESNGVRNTFNSVDYEIYLYFSADDMPVQVLSINGSRSFRRSHRPIADGILVEPAVFTLETTYTLSGRINNFIKDRWWNDLRFTFSTSNTARLYDVYLDFSYSMDFGPDYFNFDFGSYNFHVDFPEHMIRLSWGNVSSSLLSPRGTSVGIKFEKSYAYAPDSYIRPSHYEQVIVIDRKSEIQVFNEGREIYRRTLDVGTYRLRDFILYTGANKITVRITPLDGTPYKEIDFDILYSSSLLAPGEIYYGAALVTGRRNVLSSSKMLDGAFRIPIWNGRSIEYDLRDVVLSSYVRTGLTETLTFDGSLALQNSPTEFAGFRPNAKVAMEFTHANILGTTRYTLNVTERTFEDGSFRIPGIYAGIGHQISTGWAPVSSISLNANYSSPEEVNVENRHRVTLSTGFSGRVGIMSYGLNASASIVTDDIQKSTWSLSDSMTFSVSRNVWLSASVNLNGVVGESVPNVSGRVSATIRFDGGSVNASANERGAEASVRYASGDHSFEFTADTDRYGDINEYGLDADYTYSGDFFNVNVGLNTDSLFHRVGADFRVRTSSVFADGLFAMRASIPSNYMLVRQQGALKGNNISVGSAGSSSMEEIPSLLDVGIYTGLPSGSSSDSFIIYSQGDSSFSQLSSFPVNIAGSERKGYVLTVSADNKYSASGEVMLPDGTPWINGASPMYAVNIEDGRVILENTEEYIFTDSDGWFVTSALTPGYYGFDVRYNDSWILIIFTIGDIEESLGQVQLLAVDADAVALELPDIYSSCIQMITDSVISPEEFFQMLYPVEGGAA